MYEKLINNLTRIFSINNADHELHFNSDSISIKYLNFLEVSFKIDKKLNILQVNCEFNINLEIKTLEEFNDSIGNLNNMKNQTLYITNTVSNTINKILNPMDYMEFYNNPNEDQEELFKYVQKYVEITHRLDIEKGYQELVPYFNYNNNSIIYIKENTYNLIIDYLKISWFNYKKENVKFEDAIKGERFKRFAEYIYRHKYKSDYNIIKTYEYEKEITYEDWEKLLTKIPDDILLSCIWE